MSLSAQIYLQAESSVQYAVSVKELGSNTESVNFHLLVEGLQVRSSLPGISNIHVCSVRKASQCDKRLKPVFDITLERSLELSVW